MKSYIKSLRRVLSSPGNRGNQFGGLLRAIWWTLRSRLTQRPVKRHVFSKRNIWCYPNGYASRSVMLFGEWAEYDSLKFIQTFIRPEDNFLDVGANVGLFTLLASETLPPKSIYCVEPGEVQRSRLTENIDVNGLSGIHIFPYAVGDSEDVVSFTKGDSVSHVSCGPAGTEQSTETVTVRRLDDFLPRKVFQLSKIDVEGFELHALMGANSLIFAGLLPVFLIEVNGGSEKYGIRSADTFTYLDGCGYRLGVYNHDRMEINTTEPPWDDVLAFNQAGLQLILERIPGIQFA